MQRRVAVDILRLVVLGTPVGNKTIWNEPGKARVGYAGGRARANWFVSINSPSHTTTDNVDPGGGGAISAGSSTISTAGPGNSIHLTNNLPYIIPLNEGHSHQAPVGYIELAIQAAVVNIHGQKVTEEGSL